MSASDTSRYADLSENIEDGHAPVSPEELGAESRLDRIQLLKAQIKAGTYQADVKDIAMQLAAAMDPLM
jgi:anti-sigma28 factor (negative regulator of flagellin synthesis)